MNRAEATAERLLSFASYTLRVSAELPENAAGRVVVNQLSRCGPAGGAHYEEARAAESRPDFIHKLGIALKELRESVYWLKLIDRAEMIPEHDLKPMIAEGSELVAMLTASVRTAKANRTRRPVARTS